MPYIHIIALYEIFVILVTLYFIIKLHFKNNRISKEEDFIDLYEKRRKRLIENAGINFPMKNYLLLLILSYYPPKKDYVTYLLFYLVGYFRY